MPDAQQSTRRRTPDGASVLRASWITPSLLLLAIALYILILATMFPIDMDELLPYHPIACSSPSQTFNVFTAACGGYPINLGPLEFQRAFEYIGAIPALVMSPLLATTHWAGWHLLAGVVALILIATGITVSAQLPRSYSLVVIAWVPLALATIHDTGPIRYSMIAIAWTPALIRLFCTSARLWTQVTSLVVLTLAWVASTESKPFFLYLIPGAIVWSAAALSLNDTGFLCQHARKVVLALGLASVASLLMTVILTVDGQPYLTYLASFGSPNSLWMSAGMGGVFLFIWPMTAQRFVLQIPNVDSHFPDLLQGAANALPLSSDRGAPVSLLLVAMALIAVVSLVAWSFWKLLARDNSGSRRQALWLLTATASLFLGAVLSRGGSVHHFVFAQVPIIVLVILALRRKGWGYKRTTGVVLSVSTLAVAAMLSIPFKPEVSRDIDVVMSEAIRRSTPGSVVNCQPWGCYYQYALANRGDIPIVWAERPDQQAQLLALMPDHGIIWHVCRECDVTEVAAGFPDTKISRVKETASGWTLYRVES